MVWATRRDFDFRLSMRVVQPGTELKVTTARHVVPGNAQWKVPDALRGQYRTANRGRAGAVATREGGSMGFILLKPVPSKSGCVSC
jgi:hypothetical protein